MKSTCSDAWLNFWGDVYVASRLSRCGLSFEVFLENPEGWLARLGLEDAPEIMASGYLPLLPEQGRVRQQWRAAEPHGKPELAMRGGCSYPQIAMVGG